MLGILKGLAGLVWAHKSLAAGTSPAPITDLVIANKVISPDGFSRSTVLAGGTLPGPVIKGFKGDRFQLNVVNVLTDDTMLRTTSMHWHGISQRGTSWADGATFVTQCPIPPNSSFLYDFRVPDQAGTFWYHSHDSTQYCDGLRGAFIVYDRLDPHRHLYDVDDDSTIITLSDWYHVTALSAKGQKAPIVDSTLINGIGRYPGGPAVPLAVVEVQRFKRYRLRIISMSCDPNFTFSIDGHELLVIEADGENTEPVVVDSLTIYAGQRYSVILFANNTVGNYWIRSEPNARRGPTGFEGGINSAILRYVGAPDTEPPQTMAQRPSTTRPLREVDLHPLLNPLAPGLPWAGGADVVLNIFYEFDATTLLYTMNGFSFTPPTVPILLQILSGAHSAQELLPKESIYALPPNKVIEISLPEMRNGLHPFHLHGHSFSVIRSAGSDNYNFASPVRRDTVNTGIGNDNVTIRFVTDNAGPWFLHCHIDWHADLGLGVVFAEDVEGISRSELPPAAWKELCPA